MLPNYLTPSHRSYRYLLLGVLIAAAHDGTDFICQLTSRSTRQTSLSAYIFHPRSHHQSRLCR